MLQRKCAFSKFDLMETDGGFFFVFWGGGGGDEIRAFAEVEGDSGVGLIGGYLGEVVWLDVTKHKLPNG